MGHLYSQNQSHLISEVIRKASTFLYSYEVLLNIISLINQSLEVKLSYYFAQACQCDTTGNRDWKHQKK